MRCAFLFLQLQELLSLCQGKEVSAETALLLAAVSSTNHYISPQPRATEELSRKSLFLMARSQLQLAKTLLMLQCSHTVFEHASSLHHYNTRLAIKPFLKEVLIPNFCVFIEFLLEFYMNYISSTHLND